jgi:hypothetical protein
LTGVSWTRFFYLKLWGPLIAAKWNMPAICTTIKDGTVHSCKVSFKNQPAILSVKAVKDFSIFSSGGNFMQQSGTCRQNAKLRMVLINPLKFG